MNILYLDSEEDIVDLASDTLEGLGVRVLKANNAFEAYNIIKAKSIDLVIIEITIWNQTGVEFFKTIDAPTLFTTTNPDLLTNEDALELGSLGILKKPFCFSELELLVSRMGG